MQEDDRPAQIKLISDDFSHSRYVIYISKKGEGKSAQQDAPYGNALHP